MTMVVAMITMSYCPQKYGSNFQCYYHLIICCNDIEIITRNKVWEQDTQAPDEVWVACRLQQLQPEEGEDGCLQQLHQAVYLHQHLHSHGQIGIGCDDIAGMAVGPRQEAQAQHGASAVAPAAVKAVEEVGSSLGFCGFSQQAPQRLGLLAAQA